MEDEDVLAYNPASRNSSDPAFWEGCRTKVWAEAPNDANGQKDEVHIRTASVDHKIGWMLSCTSAEAKAMQVALKMTPAEQAACKTALDLHFTWDPDKEWTHGKVCAKYVGTDGADNVILCGKPVGHEDECV